MNSLSQSKIVLYLAVIFVAGGITGTVIAWGSAKRKMLQPPSMEKVCSFMEDKLKSRLDLTPEQMAKIQPILNQTACEMKAIHAQTLEQIDRTIQKANEQIAKELNAEQRRKLEEMEIERREFMQKRLKGPPGTAGR